MTCDEKKYDNIPTAINIFVVVSLLANILIGIIVIIPYICIKKNKERSDHYKIFYKIFELFLSFYIIFFVYVDDIKFTGQHLPEAPFISFYFLSSNYFRLSISSEEYFSMNDPTNFMRRLLKKSYNFINYFIFLFIVASFYTIHFLLRTENKINQFNYIICNVGYNFLYVSSILLYCVVAVLMIFNFIFLVKKFLIVKYIASNSKIKKRLLIEIVDLVINKLFILFIIILLIMINKKEKNEEIKELHVYFYIYLIWLILMLLLDNFILAFKTYNSDFYSFFLVRTVYSKIYKIFGTNESQQNENYSEKSMSLISNETRIDNSSFYYENHVIRTFDQNVNFLNLTLYLLYSKKKIEINNIDSSSAHHQTINNKKQLYENFTFEMNEQKNDFIDEKNRDLLILIQNYNVETLTIKVKSFFMEDFSSILKEKGIDVNILKSTFLNQFSKLKCINRDPEKKNFNNQTFLGKYVKQVNLKSHEQLILKSLDKEYSLEILPSNFFNKNNLTFLKSYINHIKINNHTFLPILIGAFIVKINGLSEICFLVTKNKIKELKKNYNSWYMIKINNNLKFNLVTSSKDRHSNMVIEDEKFLSNKRDKVYLCNYTQFKECVEQDIEFLRNSKIINFSLLMLYYELGTNQFNSNITHNSNDDKYGFRVSALSKNDISSIPIETSKKELCADSTVKDIGNMIDISKHGFEANYKNFRCYNYFMFDNVFQEKSLFKSNNFYNSFKNFLISKFDEMSI